MSCISRSKIQGVFRKQEYIFSDNRIIIVHKGGIKWGQVKYVSACVVPGGESNPYLMFRKHLFYPLNYQGNLSVCKGSPFC